MNIKKNIMKTMCAALACTTIMSNLIPVYATEAIITESPMDESVGSGSDWTVTEENLENIEVTYQQTASYIVTIPKTIALGTNKQAVYSVKVTGDIDTNQRVYVAPVDGISSTENIDFYMKDQTPESKKADVVATVTQNRLYWNSDDVASGHEETNNSISAPDLTTGNWKGTFQVAINLETMGEHVHNYVDGVCTGCGEKDPNAEHEHTYVDGKCDCGAIDPDHTHNYEDGKCTICGKETDPYEVAPANEFRNWKYVLDDENNIITLQQYTNTSSTDVIVYANYVVNGKTYKTQLADAGYNGTAYNSPYMFNNKENIKTIKFSDSLNTSNVTNMCGMFSMNTWGATSALTSIDFGKGFDTSNVTNMYDMFFGCASLTDIDLSSFDTGNVTNMSRMFDNCKVLSSIDLSSFDTSKVTSMDYMFYTCPSLISVKQNFDTSNITNMSYMFAYCNSLENLDVSNFDTSKVTDMSWMFIGCKLLTDLDVRNFNTSNVTKMDCMFSGCESLINLDVSSFDTSKVTSAYRMFEACKSVANLDLSNFDTSNITSMNSMFMDCSSLVSLDLSSFDTRNVTNMVNMFRRASSLKTIYATSGKWSTSKATTTDMFSSCGTSSVTYK